LDAIQTLAQPVGNDQKFGRAAWGCHPNSPISFLQTEASLKKARGSKRERATFECKTIYTAPLEFLYKGNIELHECPVKFWNYSGFVWPFYTLIEFLVI